MVSIARQYNKVDRLKKWIYKPHVSKAVFITLLASLFVFGIRFGYGLFDDAQGVFGIIAIFALYYGFSPNTNCNILDINFGLIISAFFLMAVFKYMNYPIIGREYDETSYAWVLPTVYMLAKFIICESKNDTDNRVFGVLVAVAAGLFIQGLLTYYGMIHGKGISVDGTWSHTFWSELQDGTRNTWDAMFAMTWGALFYACIKRKENKLFFIYVVLADIISLSISLFFQGRTSVLMVALCLVLLSIYYLLKTKISLIIKQKKIITAVVIVVATMSITTWMLIKNNLVGFGEAYKNSFLSRDGGILNNIRFKVWVGGFNNIFRYEKGGWEMEAELYDGIYHTHNSWLEFGRNYDIIVFSLLAALVIIGILIDLVLLFIHSAKHSIIYLLIGMKIPIILLSFLNPDVYRVRDSIIYVVFLWGISYGLYEKLEGKSIYIYRQRLFTIGICLLFLLLLSCSYMDWWYDRLDLVKTFILPLIMFIAGGIINRRIADPLFRTLYIIVVICLGMAYYYTKQGMESVVVLASFLVCVLTAFAAHYFKINKGIYFFIIIFVGFALNVKNLLDGRILIIKESFKLLRHSPIGTSWVLSQDNYLGITSSYNFFIENARDYGWIILGLWGIFEIIGLLSIIKILKTKVDFLDYVIIGSFVIFSYSLLLGTIIYNNKLLLAIIIYIYGFIFSQADKTELEARKRKINEYALLKY